VQGGIATIIIRYISLPIVIFPSEINPEISDFCNENYPAERARWNGYLLYRNLYVLLNEDIFRFMLLPTEQEGFF